MVPQEFVRSKGPRLWDVLAKLDVMCLNRSGDNDGMTPSIPVGLDEARLAEDGGKDGGATFIGQHRWRR